MCCVLFKFSTPYDNKGTPMQISGYATVEHWGPHAERSPHVGALEMLVCT